MTRILHVKRSEQEDMSAFADNLEKTLQSIGLEKVGRIGKWEVAGPRFPSTYAFESQGEGGFILEFGENNKVYSDSSNRDTTEVDLSVVPIGANGSLVQRTYEHLQKVSSEKGYNCFERRVKD